MNKRIHFWVGLFAGALGFTVFAHVVHLAAFYMDDIVVTPPSLWLPSLAGWLMICATYSYIQADVLYSLFSHRSISIKKLINNPVVWTTLVFVLLFQHAMTYVNADVIYSVLSGVVLAYYYWCYYNLTNHRLSE